MIRKYTQIWMGIPPSPTLQVLQSCTLRKRNAENQNAGIYQHIGTGQEQSHLFRNSSHVGQLLTENTLKQQTVQLQVFCEVLFME